MHQTRNARRRAREDAEAQLPAIYLDRAGPARAVTRFKWFAATIVVGMAGLFIIGAVMYASMDVDSTGGLFSSLKKVSLNAIKPDTKRLLEDKPVGIAFKTNKLVTSTKGLATKNIIFDQVTERRGTREFMSRRTFVRLVSTLATERPEDETDIPPFTSLQLMGEGTQVTPPRDHAANNAVEANVDGRVTVRYQEVPGGFLPHEDNQELSDSDVERLIAETDALYAESEASLADVDVAPDSIEAKAEVAPEKNTTVLFKKNEDENPDEGFDTRILTARGGESLDSLIKSAGVDTAQANVVTEAIVKVTKTKKLRHGEEIRLALTPSALDDGSLEVAKISIFYRSSPVITLARTADGLVPSHKPVGEEENGDGAQRASLYLSTYRAALSQELPQDFITKFLKIHAYDVDFKQRVKTNDSIEMFYDLVTDEHGNEKPGELLYAAFTIGGETRGYYRFRTPDGQVDYYDEKGSNSKKFLMRTPLRAGRLTSGFGYRKHPLFGIVRLHSGVDWAGPVGTPIYASGNGTVEVAGREGGYGNYVRIRHANGYKTAYAHMVRFAEGVVKGAKVRQGQTIGYVGNTGSSTGPHLHYEVLVNSRFVNPLSIKIPRSRQLQGRLLSEFRKEKSRIDELMHRPPVKTRLVSIDR